jgi:CheY-like chemotaxis protein
MNGGQSPARGPIFGVRFESYDDFLVEYTDHLRRGLLVLPLAEPPDAGSPVRLKVTLPDSQVLYLTGRMDDPGQHELAEGEAMVRVDPLDEDQEEALDACVHGGHIDGAVDDVNTERLQILVVDDSVSVRLSLGDLLRARGFRVRVAENGLEALSAALKNTPHVILSDVEMPTMDGWKLLHMVRNRPRLAHVPFVFLTHLGDEMSRLRGYRMGVDDYLPKDTPPQEIVTRVLSVAERRSRSDRAEPESQGLRGDLRHVRLGSVLGFLELERRTGELHVTGRGDQGVIKVMSGAFVSVDPLGPGVHPHDRVYQMLAWDRGEFEFLAGEEVPAPEDATPISYLLMEFARREDESRLDG